MFSRLVPVLLSVMNGVYSLTACCVFARQGVLESTGQVETDMVQQWPSPQACDHLDWEGDVLTHAHEGRDYQVNGFSCVE
ncbi:hypothetical protein Q7C36_012743 [Tachysurus vachellii]|uniref:Secreted protein n=1 Tax=Tachysurus vachellii TaxID=175792 RepID=A0AA88MQ36_TACVA|nr:hypothetical protein Q7C36_012743 [Tachysurus vachellii]